MRQLNEYGIMAHWKGSVSELSNYYRTCLEQLDLFVETRNCGWQR